MNIVLLFTLVLFIISWRPDLSEWIKMSPVKSLDELVKCTPKIDLEKISCLKRSKACCIRRYTWYQIPIESIDSYSVLRHADGRRYSARSIPKRFFTCEFEQEFEAVQYLLDIDPNVARDVVFNIIYAAVENDMLGTFNLIVESYWQWEFGIVNFYKGMFFELIKKDPSFFPLKIFNSLLERFKKDQETFAEFISFVDRYDQADTLLENTQVTKFFRIAGNWQFATSRFSVEELALKALSENFVDFYFLLLRSTNRTKITFVIRLYESIKRLPVYVQSTAFLFDDQLSQYFLFLSTLQNEDSIIFDLLMDNKVTINEKYKKDIEKYMNERAIKITKELSTIMITQLSIITTEYLKY